MWREPAAARGRGVILGIETSCDETAAAVVSRTTAACSPPSSPRRRISTRATAASCRRSRRAGTSSSSSPVVRDALDEAGTALDDDRPRRRHAGPGTRRCAPRRHLGREGARLGAPAPARPGRPPRGARRVALPRAGPASSRRSLCLLASGGHTLLLAVRERGSVGAPRHDARRRGGRGVRQGRAAPRSRLSGRRRDRPARAEGDPSAFAFPVARVPGLDFSFSGLKTALLYAVRELGPTTELERATRRSRGVVPARDRAGARAAARARRREQTGARSGRRRGRGRRELRAPRGAARARAFAPLALCTDNAAMIASAARYVEPLPYPRYRDLDAYASIS